MKKKLKNMKEQFFNEMAVENKVQRTAAKVGIEWTEPIKVKGIKRLFATRKAMTLTLSSFLMTALLITFSSIYIINYQNTPVYQGMEVSSIDQSLRLNPYNFKLLSSVNDDFNDQIEESIGVETIEGISYYATQGETIAVTVKIDNPQFFEILSFTLNGKLYQTFEFLTGSNSEQIIVQFIVQETSGIEEITIDAIKYVDDTTIKNARFDSDRTIQIGVLYEDAPSVSNVTTLVQATTFGISFVAYDNSQLINLSNGLMIFIFDGTKIIHRTSVSLGTNVIPYSNLRMGQTYQYAIIGVFDLLDGMGKRAFTLYNASFTTEKGFKIENIDQDYERVTFDVNQFELDNGIIDKIDLLENDILVDTIDDLQVPYAFESLKSNTEYTIEMTYHYDILVNQIEEEITDTVRMDFTTDVRPNPTLDMINPASDQESISYDVLINDTNNLGSVLSVELFLDDNLIATENGLVEAFNDLFSNRTYKVVVTYQYDLVDGSGFKTMTDEITIDTNPKEVPTFEWDLITPNQETVSFNYVLTDNDQIATVDKIEIVDGETVIQTINFADARLFDQLLSDKTYDIKLYYTYNLNEGNDAIQVIETTTVETLAKAVPNYQVTSYDVTQTSLEFTYLETDIDNISEPTYYELWHDGNLISTQLNLEIMTFSGLLSNNTYELRIHYTYDLNDGQGSHNQYISQLITTNPVSTPEIVLTMAVDFVNILTVFFEVTDIDQVSSIISFDLYKDGLLIDSKNTYDNLNPKVGDPNTMEGDVSFVVNDLGFYTIVVVYSYDLNDGNGIIEIDENSALVDNKLVYEVE